jgi:hypothetical protein
MVGRPVGDLLDVLSLGKSARGYQYQTKGLYLDEGRRQDPSALQNRVL